MSVTYPVDLLADFSGWTTEFELVERQEQSREASGRTYVKSLGSPLWRLSAVSRSLSINNLDGWRARLEAMENGLRTFYGYSKSRCRPIKHPGLAALPTGEVASINANRKSLTVSGLTGIVLSVGDMIQIGDTDLHRVVDTAGSPMVEFEVRPHLWQGVAAGAAVSISKPHCVMAIVPGSVSSTADPQTGRGVVSFQAMEAR